MLRSLQKHIVHFFGGIMPNEEVEWAISLLRERSGDTLLHDIIADKVQFVPENEIFKKTSRGTYLAGELLTPEQAQKIEKDAETFHDSLLWRALVREIDYVAYRNGFVRAKTEDDMLAAKMLLYLKDALDRRLQYMSGKNTKVRAR